MYSLDNIVRKLKCYPLILQADEIKAGLIRIATPFQYPDGSHIDIFVEVSEGVLDFQHARVTDLGSTADWLSHIALHSFQSSRRRSFVQDIMEVLRVNWEGEEIFTWIESDNQLPDAVMRVAQASLRLSDLLYTQRFMRGPELHEAFGEFLDSIQLRFDERVEIEIPHRKITLPYQVYGETVTSWVQLLGSRSPESAHSTSIEAFTRWHDIKSLHREIQRVTVVDDQFNVYKEADLVRLVDYSQLIAWSDQSTLQETLKR